VLVVGSAVDDPEISPHTMLTPDGMLIVIEADAARATELRRRLSQDAAGERTTIIGGDPRRMVYKLAGPFDVIVCDSAHLSLRPMLDKLLARDGVLITHGKL
jgi:predicted O-methyltransferase YrrM